MIIEITTEQVKELHPTLGDKGVKLTKDYINLTLQAIELKLFDEKELHEIEKKYGDMDNMFEKIQNLSADILTLLKAIVNDIVIPKDPSEFKEWEKHSDEYLKVVCHDAFFDIFISTNEALNEGWD